MHYQYYARKDQAFDCYKTHEKGDIKLRMRNLDLLNELTEDIQNHYLDKLRLIDEDIEALKKALKMLNQ